MMVLLDCIGSFDYSRVISLGECHVLLICFSALLLGPASRPCFSALLLFLMAALLLTGLSPIHAGSWKFSCTGGGSKTYTNTNLYYTSPNSSQDWSSPGPSTGLDYSIPSFGLDAFSSSVLPNTKRTADVTISAMITLTWMPDTSLPSDPAPPSVWLIETSHAEWTAQSRAGTGPLTTGSGTANDGIQDNLVPTMRYGVKSGENANSANAPVQIPPAHWMSYPVSKGTVILTRSFAAHAEASNPSDGTQGEVNIGASFDGYTVRIHLQPYNFRRTYFDSQPPKSAVVEAGALQFHYNWSSTSGNKADLAGIQIYESLLYPSTPSTKVGDVVGYLPPPPFGWSPPFYFEGAPVPAESTIGFGDLHTWGNGKASFANCFIKPYQTSSFDATQNYIFYDPLTMVPGDRQFIPTDSGPFTITNAVVADPNSPSGYSFVVTKSGISSLRAC